ncbi:MAG: amidohydrolase family protein [Anaerolineales bacterium]
MQIIDCHTHILAPGSEEDSRRFLQDLCRGNFVARGLLPSEHAPTEEDWEACKWLFEPIDPETSIEDHETAGVTRTMILGVAPSDYTPYGIRGTIDLAGVTGVDGEPSIDKGNDYIAALVQRYPEKFIGFGAVNPRYRGTEAAVKEVERLADDLKLTGLKLYPMYDLYSPDDRDLVFPVFAKALELGIPVMVHQASSPARFAPLEWGRPYLLDAVGREFPDLKVIVAHAGLPWLDECVVLVERHPNFHMDVSFTNSLLTREEMFRFLNRCKRFGVPLTKVCWGTDYPCFDTVETLVERFLTMNEEADRLGMPRISDEEMALMTAGNFLRITGLN